MYSSNSTVDLQPVLGRGLGLCSTRLALWLAVVVLGLLSATVQAQAKEKAQKTPQPSTESLFGKPPRVQLALRAPVLAIPIGNAESGDSLASRHTFMFAVNAEAGARLTPSWYLGAYLGLSWGGYGSHAGCESDYVKCGSDVLRFGLAGEYHPLIDRLLDPWFGLAFGFEQSQVDYSATGNPRREWNAAQGFEVILTAGLGFALGAGVTLGPYTSISVGRYVHSRTEIDGHRTYAGAIDQQATHGWVHTGLRLAF